MRHINYSPQDVGIIAKGIERARRRGKDWFVVMLSNKERAEYNVEHAEYVVEYLQQVFKNNTKEKT